MSPDHDQPDVVTTLVYEPLQAPDIIPIDKEQWEIQVGHEGVRLNFKDQYGPLSQMAY